MVRKKSIAIIIEKLAQRGGGAERVLVDLANTLFMRGYQVEIVTHEYRGKSPAYDLLPGIIRSNLRPTQRSHLKRAIQPARKALNKLHSVPLIDRLSWLNRHGAFWRRLGRHLSATKPDIAIAFMPPAITALAYAKASDNLLRIASTHNAPEQDYENVSRWDPSKIDQRRRMQCLNQIDKICVLLPSYADYYDFPSGKVVVVPNAVRQNSYIVPPEERSKVVIFSGRLEKVKRPELAVLAWKEIQDNHPDWHFHIYGEGSLKQELKHLIARREVKRTRICGHQKEVLEKVASASVLLHPAAFEGFPMSVCEALAAGTPVVGFSDCSGLNTLVRDEINGVLARPLDRLETLARSLDKVISDERFRFQLSLAGPSSVSMYSPDTVADLWESIIDENTLGGR